MILGLDEAGRGPVIGPLVLCGVWIDAAAEQRLARAGVQDSKRFGSGPQAELRREQLARTVRAEASEVLLAVAEADEVDRRVAQGELNGLERDLARRLIQRGPPAARILADGARLFGPLGRSYPQLSAEDRADSRHLAVAAASIVAKAERDRRLRDLLSPAAEALGLELRGGGYANGATAALLRAHVQRFGTLPPGVRLSWSWAVLDELRDADGALPLLGHGIFSKQLKQVNKKNKR